MWAVFLRNPLAILLAVALHIGLAMLVFMTKDLYTPPLTPIKHSAIQARVTDIKSIKKQAKELAKIQAKQRAAEWQAQRTAQLTQAKEEAQKQELSHQKEIARQQIEATAIAATKRREEIKRQHNEAAAIAKQQEEIQRQQAQMTETARLQAEFKRQQAEVAAETKRQAEIETAAKQAKQQAEIQRQQTAALTEAMQQEEIQRQQAEASAAAMQQEQMQQQQTESSTAELNDLQNALAYEQNERDNQELITLQQQIYEQIRTNWRIPARSKFLRCTLRVNINLNGEVLKIQVIKSSGNRLFDSSAERSVWRASPLPVPKNKHLFDEFLILEFDPIL